MEAGTINMLMTGFFFIIGLGVGILIKLWKGSRNRHLIWFGAQLVFLILAFYYSMNLLKNEAQVPEAMLSEENTLSLGYIGLLWALSMVCMFTGIWKMSFDRKSK